MRFSVKGEVPSVAKNVTLENMAIRFARKCREMGVRDLVVTGEFESGTIDQATFGVDPPEPEPEPEPVEAAPKGKVKHATVKVPIGEAGAKGGKVR